MRKRFLNLLCIMMVAITTFLSHPAPSTAQSTLSRTDQQQVMRAVLRTELERRSRRFESRPQLSSENIESLTPEQIASEFKLPLLSPVEISESAHNFGGVDYLVFRDFLIQGDDVVVTLSFLRVMTVCFGRSRRTQKEIAYRLTRQGRDWRAELICAPGVHFALSKKQ